MRAAPLRLCATVLGTLTLSIAACRPNGPSPRADHSLVAHSGDILILGGEFWDGNAEVEYADVWRSPDGKIWNCLEASAPWGPRSGHSAVEFEGSIYLAGGSQGSHPDEIMFNDVWRSDDGVAWTMCTAAAPWTPRSDFACISFRDRIWILGGGATGAFVNDIWSSADGKDWRLETLSAQWPARSAHACVVHDGKLWLIGGVTNEPRRHSDIWSTVDGTNWKVEILDAPWRPRQGHGLATFSGEIWIIGGFEGDGMSGVETNSIWRSKNGVAWTASPPPRWGPRSGHRVAAFSGGLALFGGYHVSQVFRDSSASSKFFGDAWTTQDGVSWVCHSK